MDFDVEPCLYRYLNLMFSFRLFFFFFFFCLVWLHRWASSAVNDSICTNTALFLILFFVFLCLTYIVSILHL